MPFIAHMHELRRRLFYVVLALLAGSAVGYHFHAEVLHILIAPLNQKLYYSNPAGGLDFIFKVCLLFGMLVTLPAAVYNIIKFITPAVPERARINLVIILFTSVSLAAIGISFAYFFSLPAALHFLSSFTESSQVSPLIFAGEYLTFVMVYLLSFAVMFQVPLIVAFVNKIKPLTPAGMMKSQRFVILGSFVVAAILTPTPDPLNQVIMATPMVLLYQLSVVYVWQVNRPKKSIRRQTPRSLPVQENLQDMAGAIQAAPQPQVVAVPLSAVSSPASVESKVPSVAVPRRMSRMSVDGIINGPRHIAAPSKATAIATPNTTPELAPRRIISDIMPTMPQFVTASD
jgi:sec-independent protein translocase protein TatC